MGDESDSFDSKHNTIYQNAQHHITLDEKQLQMNTHTQVQQQYNRSYQQLSHVNSNNHTNQSREPDQGHPCTEEYGSRDDNDQ